MAQGAISLIEKNLKEALTLANECAKVDDIEEDDGAQVALFSDDDLDAWREELPF